VTTTFPMLSGCDYVIPDLQSLRIIESTSSGLRLQVAAGLH
jgi:hypothetical protein